MSIKSALSFFALAAVTSLSVAACTTNTDPSAEDEVTGETQDQELRKSITSCHVDSDCVAVPRGGCCQNGWNEAVNKHHTKAYANATKCTLNPRPMCPMYLVHDTRIAKCDTGTRQCKMVDPPPADCNAPNACGPALGMPTQLCSDGSIGGNTGVCKAQADGTCGWEIRECPTAPPPSDCRTTGCSTGQYCTFCWASYACIPNGALC